MGFVVLILNIWRWSKSLTLLCKQHSSSTEKKLDGSPDLLFGAAGTMFLVNFMRFGGVFVVYD